MAETALKLEAEARTVDPDAPLSLGDIFTPGVNLADMLSPETLGRIGQYVTRDVEIDRKSREPWEKRYDRWLNIAMQVREAKSFPWPNASNIKWPLLTVASIQFQARAYPAIVDGSNLVKGRVLGPDPDGMKRERADRIGQHMTWQLLYRMPGWEEDTDKLLLMLPIVGTVIRKTFYDSIENANRSEMVTGKDFIIHYMAKSLDTAPRYTHVLHYYPYEVQEKVAAQLWRPVTVQADSEAANDDDALVDFYEQHRTLDLDQDGYPEHYVVTANKDGQVARIVPCFGPEDVTVMSPHLPKPVQLSDLMVEGVPPNLPVTVVKIARRQYFTKYGFIPSPDGAFYDQGFGSILEDMGSSIDSLVNQMIDAASLANSQGGWIGDGVTVSGGNKPFRLGEWKRANVTGGTLRENIVPLQLPGPSAVSFNLLELMIAAAQDITASSDALTGGSPATEQPTTLLARIEQAQKVISGIFKRIHRAFGCDLRILRRLNRDYLDEEEYFQLNDAEEASKIGREDYADKDLDVVPVSDPSTVSDMQKIARAEALMQFNGDPLVNQLEIRRRYLHASGQPDIKALLTVPPPSPDPKMVLEMLKEARSKIEAEAQARQSDSAAANNLITAAMTAYSMGLMEDAAMLAEMAVRMGAETGELGEPPATAPDANAGGLQPDAGVPGAAMVHGVPGGPAGADGGGMGEGLGPDGAGAEGSGSLGPAGADQV